MSNNIYTPDEFGWYFFKKNNHDSPVAVFINEDGIAFAMGEDGESFELDDLIGRWAAIEPEFK